MRTVNSKSDQAMSIFAPSSLIQKAVIPFSVVAIPKGVGAGWRGWDVRKAPEPIKENTWRGEATVTGLVGVNGIVLKHIGTQGKQSLGHMAEKLQSPLLKKAIKASETGKAGILGYVTLSCAANYLAEAISRKFFPREIREGKGETLVLVEHKEEDDDDHKDRHDSCDRLKRDSYSLPERSSKRKPEPIRHQPVTFAQNPAANSSPSNPFQFYFASATNRPAFSI